MRFLKRFVRTQIKIFQNIMRLKVTKIELEKLFDKKIHFKLEGAKGHDLIYLVKDKYNTTNIAVARFSSQEVRKEDYSNLPFVRGNSKETILREYEIYKKLFLQKLSPQPLWMNDSNTILCNSFINGTPIFEHIKQDTRFFWHYISKVMPYIQKMHTLNVTHMDMSFNNILIDENDHIYFIDFEYAPNPNMNFSEQCLYDYLRLVESSMKFLPHDILVGDESVVWMNKIKEVFSNNLNINEDTLNKLKPAIGRIYKNEDIYNMLCEVTKND